MRVRHRDAPVPAIDQASPDLDPVVAERCVGQTVDQAGDFEVVFGPDTPRLGRHDLLFGQRPRPRRRLDGDTDLAEVDLAEPEERDDDPVLGERAGQIVLQPILECDPLRAEHVVIGDGRVREAVAELALGHVADQVEDARSVRSGGGCCRVVRRRGGTER
jgi:hypothetical protein